MRKTICVCLSLVMICGLFIGCSSNTPSDNGAAGNDRNDTADIADNFDNTDDSDYEESERIETIYKLSEEIDLSDTVLDDNIADNPFGYDICLVIPSYILETEALDEIEEETNLEFDSKGNFSVTTTTNHNRVLYTDTDGWEEFKNSFANRFDEIINEINRDDSLNIYISHNEDFSEFEITGSQNAIENLPNIYITSMMRLGAFYQAILGKSLDETEVTVTVYYFS